MIYLKVALSVNIDLTPRRYIFYFVPMSIQICRCSADCLASVPGGQCSLADLKAKRPLVSARPPSGGRAATLTSLSPLYSTGLCCSV